MLSLKWKWHTVAFPKKKLQKMEPKTPLLCFTLNLKKNIVPLRNVAVTKFPAIPENTITLCKFTPLFKMKLMFLSFVFLFSFSFLSLTEQDFSVWPIRSGRFGLSRVGLSFSVWPIRSGQFGLADSVWSFRSRDISVRLWNLAEILQ